MPNAASAKSREKHSNIPSVWDIFGDHCTIYSQVTQQIDNFQDLDYCFGPSAHVVSNCVAVQTCYCLDCKELAPFGH